MNPFLPQGAFFTGVNYLSSNAGTSMWKLWDENVIRKDLKILKDYGVKILRVMPIWPDFQPITLSRCAGYIGGKPKEIRLHGKRLPNTALGQSGIDEDMMAKFQKFTEISDAFGFELIVPLLTGHVTFELLVPPALEGLDAFKDSIALKWQKKFIKGFVRFFKDCSAIKAWETGNEANCMSVVESTDAAWNWMSMITDTIRLEDNTRPIISGMHTMAIYETERSKWLLKDQGELYDYLTPHPYPCWKRWASCEPCNTIRSVFHAVTEKHFATDIGGKPSFIEEIGTWRPVFSDLEIHADMVRNILWNTWAHDSRAMLWWCAFNQEDLDVVPYEWEEPGLEHGLFTKEHKPLPAAEEYKKFSSFLSSLPFNRLPLACAEAVCLLGGDSDHAAIGHATMILAQQSGINIEFQSSKESLKDSDLYILPSAYGRGGLSVEGWKNLREKVRSGSSLYLSLNNTYLDRIAEVFSAEVKSKTCEPNEHIFGFNFNEDYFELKFTSVDFNTMISSGAGILGKADNNSPIFFEAVYGKGKVYLLGFPLEKIMIENAGSFINQKTADAWRIYKYIGEKTCLQRVLNKESSMVTITEHVENDMKKIAVVVNNSPESISEKVFIKDGWRIDSVFPPNTVFEINEKSVRITIDKNDGCVLLVKKQG